MKTKHLLMLAAAGAGYVAYRGLMAGGGGQGGPIGVMYVGWKTIFAAPPVPGLKVIAPTPAMIATMTPQQQAAYAAACKAAGNCAPMLPPK
jgi:hypothetical protein